jgi:hypothetical protein
MEFMDRLNRGWHALELHRSANRKRREAVRQARLVAEVAEECQRRRPRWRGLSPAASRAWGYVIFGGILMAGARNPEFTAILVVIAYAVDEFNSQPSR